MDRKKDRLKDEKFAEFYKKYLEAIAPDYEYLENERKEYLKENYQGIFKGYSIAVIVIAVCTFFVIKLIISDDYTVDMVQNTIILALALILFVGAVIFLRITIESYLSFKFFLKESLIKKILNIFGDVKWKRSRDRSELFKPEEFNNSGLFYFNNYNSDDEFYGQYKGAEFRVSEFKSINLDDKNEIIKNCSFIVLAYKFNKKINNRTIVSTKKYLNRFFSKDTRDYLIFSPILIIFVSLVIFKIVFPVCIFLSFIYEKICKILAFFLSHNVCPTTGFTPINNIFEFSLVLISLIVVVLFALLIFFSIKEGDIQKITKEKPVKLENSKFNKRFTVYSSDQVEARYLVTPAFMEKFYSLKTVFGAKNIRCSFFDDNLMIAIDTKRDLFELGSLFKPVKDIKTIERFYDEITAIFDLIDYFKLNEDIYLK